MRPTFSFMQKEFEKCNLYLVKKPYKAGSSGKAQNRKKNLYYALNDKGEFIIAFLSLREARVFLLGVEFNKVREKHE